VRDAVEATFRETAGFTSVYGRPPKIVAAASQPAAICHINNVIERRHANGTKIRTYTVYLLIDFASRKPKAQDAQDEFDELMEALEERLRQNKTLGTNGALMAAGEPEFSAEHSFPVTKEKAATYYAGILKFDVDEFLSGI
jgi:hypothetical protein